MRPEADLAEGATSYRPLQQFSWVPTSGMDQRLTPALIISVMPINRCVSASDMTIDSSTLTYSKGVIQHQEVSWNSSCNSASDETGDVFMA
jgi:hypothetical protein